MPFQQYTNTTRPLLAEYLVNFLQKEKKRNTSASLLFFDETIDRLISFVPKGKLLRGIFVILGSDMYNGQLDASVYNAASAVELAHSGLLIHDDIMDNDIIRRGEKTLFAQYQDKGRHARAKDSNAYGSSFGICIGDVSYFLCFQLIILVAREKELTTQIHELFAREIRNVGIAQMVDVHFSQTPYEPSLSEIEAMYLAKTARYTFSLPFILGALLAEAGEKEIEHLDNLGHHLGLIFQIKDDDIKLFESEEETGTEIGSDIRENKKTLHRALLFQKASDADKKKLKQYFGNAEITQEQVEEVKVMMESYGVKNEIIQKLADHAREAKKVITQLSIEESYRIILDRLVAYLIERRS